MSRPTLTLAGNIAFVSTRDGNEEIYAMNADGSGMTRLTKHPASDRSPAWSPDSKRIAFVSERDGNAEIYVMNADGSAPRNLTNNSASDQDPAWSPDGRLIAFASDRDSDYARFRYEGIYVMSIDGSNPRRIADISKVSYAPAWSPDGSRIAFAYTPPPRTYSQIYVMNADGSNSRQLTEPHFGSSKRDSDPAWSPDGRLIAFSSDRDPRGIYVMNADGSNVIRLIYPTGNPTWSPDGKRLINPSGNPTWSPDGKRIAFASNRDGNAEIYVMNADGSGVTSLTNHLADDYSPAWWSSATTTSMVGHLTASSDCIQYVTGARRGGGWSRSSPIPSPDGKRIAFSDNSNPESPKLYVMNTNSSAQIAIDAPFKAMPLSDPVWSPDDQRLAFSNIYLSQPGGGKFYVVNANGSGLIHVASYIGYHDILAWSPDSRQIAFTNGVVIGRGSSTQVTNYRIYVVNANGLRQPQSVAEGCDPIWEPWGQMPTVTIGQKR